MTKNLSILFVPFGTARVAATRYRIYQYLPYLEQENIKYKVFSIISEKTTKQMINSPNFGRVRKAIYYFQLVLERLMRFLPVLILSRYYKIVFLQRTTFPFGLEKLLKKANRNIVFDLDDAIFITDSKEKGLISRLKEYTKAKEVASILKVSRYAIVENEYIRSYALRYCPEVALIPGPIDTVRNFVKQKKMDNQKVVIGWIGSPSTSTYLNLLKSIFKELNKRFDIEIKLIGAGCYNLNGMKLITRDWSLEREVEELQSFDIGVMPMPNDEWTKGKLGCKMLQYMSVGVPTIASYTETNAEAIKDGYNGFLVKSEAEWLERLSLLIRNPDLRKEIGENGRLVAEERFSVKVNAPKLKAVLEGLFLNA